MIAAQVGEVGMEPVDLPGAVSDQFTGVLNQKT